MIPLDIIDTLKKSKKITILPHISADGDALGSSLALALALKKENKEVELYIEEKVPQMYSFLPGLEMITVFENNQENSWNINQETVVALDTGDMDRLGERVKIFNNGKYKINIDHHPTNTYFAQMNYVMPEASSTGEIIYHLIESLDIQIDYDIALSLYTSILTDTGGFKFSNTTSKTHYVVSQLLKHKIDVQFISFRIFDSVSEGKLKLTGSAINTIELYEDGRAAFITVTEKMIKDTGALSEDTEGIIYYARNLEGVEIAALFKEKYEGEVKVSLRSNSDIDVAKIAHKYSGGGHKKAAGCTIKSSISEAKKLILWEIKMELNAVNVK